MHTDLSSSTGSGELLLAVSIELAIAKWKVAVHDGQREKPAIHTVQTRMPLAACKQCRTCSTRTSKNGHCLRTCAS
ncbi:hypothetical protein P3T25_003430 [Paraburkholderia sp. GAS32]